MMTPAKVVERPGREDCIDPVELRRICELDGLMPPSQAESAECLAAWMNCEPEWAETFLLLARVERQEFLNSLYPRLRAFPPDERDDIGRVALEARVLSPCGLGPLVITLHDGSAIVADLDCGSWHRFEAGTRRRWSRVTGTLEEWLAVAHRRADVPAPRRPWWRRWPIVVAVAIVMLLIAAAAAQAAAPAPGEGLRDAQLRFPSACDDRTPERHMTVVADPTLPRDGVLAEAAGLRFDPVTGLWFRESCTIRVPPLGAAVTPLQRCRAEIHEYMHVALGQAEHVGLLDPAFLEPVMREMCSRWPTLRERVYAAVAFELPRPASWGVRCTRAVRGEVRCRATRAGSRMRRYRVQIRGDRLYTSRVAVRS